MQLAEPTSPGEQGGPVEGGAVASDARFAWGPCILNTMLCIIFHCLIFRRLRPLSFGVKRGQFRGEVVPSGTGQRRRLIWRFSNRFCKGLCLDQN